MRRILFCTLLLLLIAPPAWAASLYFIGEADSHTNDVNNWATSSGGTTHPAAIPGASDTAYFDGSSPSALVDAAWTVGAIDCTDYDQTLTLGANLTVQGNCTLVSGMTFTPSTYKVTFNTGSSTLTFGGKKFYDVDLGWNSGTKTLNSDLTVTHNLAQISNNHAVMDGAGNVVLSGTATFTQTTSNGYYFTMSGTGKLYFNGTDNVWTCHATNNQYTNANVDINCSTLTITGQCCWQPNTAGKSFVLTAGTVTASNCTLKLGIAVTGCTYNAAISWKNISTNWNNNKLSLTTNLISTTDFSSDNNTGPRFTGAGIVDIQGGYTQPSGDGYITNHDGSGGGYFKFSGTGTWTGNTASLTGPITINTAGTLTASGTWTIGGSGTTTFTYTAGTISGTPALSIKGGVTLDAAGMTFGNVTFPIVGTLVLTNDVTATGTTAINSNTIFSGNKNYHAQGDVTRDSSARTLSSSTSSVLLIDGGAAQAIGTTNGLDLRLNTTVNKSGNTATVADGVTIAFGSAYTPTFTLTSAQSTLAWGTALLQTTGSCNLNAGTVHDLQVSTAGTATLTGSMSAVDVTVDASRTLALGANTLSLSGNLVNNGTVSGAGGVTVTGTSAFSGTNTSFSIGTLTVNSGAALTLASTKTYTVNTAFNAIGANGATTSIVSSVADSQAKLNLGASCTHDVERVTATDIDSSGGLRVQDYRGTLDNATNWVSFSSGAVETGYAYMGG